ncbi:hypothetical protein SPBR_00631 [Sporothrix brasiliensis 5110]|uniref:RlpA-like protein double-psi beta-barrel domain-containing protein n=1 Tax=Sporothrix brasiliensis 5110 TaxID=1398154 RepID=A0A0C2ILN5_9PEZI|nr:uncharacterized protein SPBR_00631 [Sporothrix brasiliensis 5110]KIH89996.1 hypothetical protein SPBR_00631 [Sporothrix brasiliensis 5110]
MPRSTAANAIDWEPPGGGAEASSSRQTRQNRQSPTSPLARLSTIMASVRSSLVGQPPSDEEIGRAQTQVYYSEDKTTGSSSDDDGPKGRAGKAGVRGKASSLRAVSSLESLSVAQERRDAERAERAERARRLSTMTEDRADDGRFGCLPAALRRRRRVLLMAAGVLAALVLVIGLSAGLGVRAAKARHALLAGPGANMSATSTPSIVPPHPTATPIDFNVTSSANATSPTSTSTLPSSTLSSNATTVVPPTSSSTPPPAVVPSSSTTPAPAPLATPAPSPSPSPSPSPTTTLILTTPAPSPDPAPTPSPTPEPAPTPDPAPAPVPVPVPAPAPPTSPSSPSSSNPSGGPFAGDVTYYVPGLGACGRYSAATDYIAAVSQSLYDAVGAAHGVSNPNNNPLCGRRIRVALGGGVGATVDVTIVDRCTACAENDVDLSPSAFGQLAGAAMGRVQGSWFFLD